MNAKEILAIVENDVANAKKSKRDIDSKIESWLNEYNGEEYGNERDGFSKLVVKDIKKAVESFLPNAVEPFVKRNQIVRLDGVTSDDVQRAKMHESLLNYQFVRSFNRYDFVHDMFKVGATEGTTIIRCGWNYKEDEIVNEYENVTYEEMEMLTSEYDVRDLEDNQDGTFSFKTVEYRVLEDNPFAEVIRNENFYVDTSADDLDNATYCMYEFDSTLSDLREAGIYDEDALDKLSSKSPEAEDSSLGQSRKNRNREFGQYEDDESKDPSLKKVTVKEYWGYIDLNEDDVAEPVVVTYVDNVIIRQEENPYPDKKFPFVAIQFIRTPFQFWGSPLADVLSDNQKIRTSLMRGIIDNVARSNNGKKFYRKGSLDPINKRKLELGLATSIEVNGDKNDMWDGSYNEIPATIFNLMEIIQQDSENLSGINRHDPSISSQFLNSTATGASIVSSVSQKRMMEIIRRYSEGLREVFRKWISYNKVYLDEQKVIRIGNEFVPFTKDDISGEFDIDIIVGTEGVDENKANQITMLMQQIGALGGVVPPQVISGLLSKLADIWNFPDIAETLRNVQPPQPDQNQIAQMQAEYDNISADTKLKEAKAIETMSKANKSNVDSKLSAYGMK